MSPKFFGGNPDHMGTVAALPATDFADLVTRYIGNPVLLPLERKDFFALPPAEQGKAKAVDYIVPAAFATSPSPRKTELAQSCNLVMVDIDDSGEAQRLLNSGFGPLLDDYNAVVYHTARSTPDGPRLRVVVEAKEVPAARYADAVASVASLLGLAHVTKESKVVVQPMYLPVQFADEGPPPLVYERLDGRPFELADGAASAQMVDPADPEMGDLDYLRAPVEGITEQDIRDALDKLDPDCPMQTWVERGMALKHQFGEAGYPLWHDWSAKGTKYPGEENCRVRWDSFEGQTKNRVPVTVRSVIKAAVEAGWNNNAMDSRLTEACRGWIKSEARGTEELLDQGAKRIAKLGNVVDALKQKTLISDLYDAMAKRGIKGPTKADLTKEVRRLTSEAARAQQQTPSWVNDYVFITASKMFFAFNDRRKIRSDVFDLIYRSPNPDLTPTLYMLHDAKCPVVENARYNPTTRAVTFFEEGLPYVNTYRPSFPKPDRHMAEEAGANMMEHLLNLSGRQEYADTLLDFSAFLVQYPGRKIRWCPIIQSTFGAGKGLFGYMLQVALGVSNVGHILGEHLMEGTHNTWAAGNQLNILNELRVMGLNKLRVMDKLKAHISDDRVSLRNLYEPVQTVPNITNYIAFTNWPDALSIHKDERRYFVIFSPMQLGEHVRARGSAYYPRMVDTCRRLAPGLRAFLEAWPISERFNPDGHAPVTPFLEQLAQQSASPLAFEVSTCLMDQPHPLVRSDLVSLTALRASIPAGKIPPFTDQALSSVMREQGFIFAGRYQVDDAKHSLWVRGMAAETAAMNAQLRMDLF